MRKTDKNGHVWNYVYDAANRLIEEISPAVNVTRLNATIWRQDFDESTAGLEGSLIGQPALYRVDSGRMILQSLGSGTETIYSLNHQEIDPQTEELELRDYSFSQRTRFVAGIKTTDNVEDLYFTFGMENGGSVAAGDLWRPRVCRGGRLDLLRAELHRHLSPTRHLRRQDL
jgi:YD repeat-containing protein